MDMPADSYISNTTEKTDDNLCFKDNSYTKNSIPVMLTLNCTYYGRYVIYYNKKTQGITPSDYSAFAFNELCEFEVYGKLHLFKVFVLKFLSFVKIVIINVLGVFFVSRNPQ